MNIYLVGYRGAGKSMVAPRLAERLGPGWTWKDQDAEIEGRAGQSIADIFATSGESSFREMEERMLAELGAGDRLIVATGGGVILREANRRVLAAGYVVWLQTTPETIHERIIGDESSRSRRPRLTSKDSMDEIRAVLAARIPLYRQVANLMLTTDRVDPAELVDAIAMDFRKFCQTPAGVGNHP